MRKIFYIVCMLSIVRTSNAFEPMSKWGGNKASTPLNRERLTSHSPSPLERNSRVISMHDAQEVVQPWSPEWIVADEETRDPSICGRLTAGNVCMCAMSSLCVGLFVWLIAVGKISL